MAVASEGLEATTTTDLPQMHRMVFAPTSKDLPIRAEGDRLYSIGVTLEGLEATTTTDLPQAYGPVTTPTSKSFPIGFEGYRSDLAGLTM
jgi:hypothetical protein